MAGLAVRPEVTRKSILKWPQDSWHELHITVIMQGLRIPPSSRVRSAGGLATPVPSVGEAAGAPS